MSVRELTYSGKRLGRGTDGGDIQITGLVDGGDRVVGWWWNEKRTSYHLKMAALLMVFRGIILPSVRRGGWSQPAPSERAFIFFTTVGSRRLNALLVRSGLVVVIVKVTYCRCRGRNLFVIFGDFLSVASFT